MGATLSLDLRERIVRAVEKGASRHAVAQRFEVAVSTVIKLMQRYRTTGSVVPRKIGGYRKPALLGHERRVTTLLGERPDITYKELTLALRADGIEVGKSAVWRFVQTLGWTRKKRRFMPLSRNDRTLRRRAMPGAPAKRN